MVSEDTGAIALHSTLVIVDGVAGVSDCTGTHPLVIVLRRRGSKINDSVIFERARLPFPLEKVNK